MTRLRRNRTVGRSERSDAGYVTIFLLLLISVLLLVFAGLTRSLDRRREEAEAAGTLATAVSGVKAEYNRYIFDRYHILLLDVGFGGKGKGEIEELITQSIEENSGFSVSDVQLTEVRYLGEDKCAEFRRQIRESLIYLGLEAAADEFIGKTDGQDEPVSQSRLDELEAETKGHDTDEAGGEGNEIEETDIGGSDGESSGDFAGDVPEGYQPDSGKKKDPRKGIRKITPAGLALLILPENARFSDAEIPMDEVPSRGLFQNEGALVDNGFRSFSGLRKTISGNKGWGSSLTDHAAALVYAGKMFRCLTDPADEGEKSALNLELEYLVSGAPTDAENYKKAVSKLIALRLGFNFASLLADPARMAEVKSVAISVTALTPFLYPLTKYLIAACWAYAESAADVYLLVRGKKVNLTKSHAAWKTDLTHLLDFSALSGEEGDSHGLTYREYLLILLAFDMDAAYLHMLDVMQINACQADVSGGDPTFRMVNAITAFGVDAEIDLSDTRVCLHEEGGY